MKKFIHIPDGLKYSLLFSLIMISGCIAVSSWYAALFIVFFAVLNHFLPLTANYAKVVDDKGVFVSVPLYIRDLRIVTIGEKEVKSGNLCLNWEQIKAARIISFEHIHYRRGHSGHKDIEMICLSSEDNIGDYISRNRKKIIMIQVSKKTYTHIKKYGSGKSKVIDDLLDIDDYWYKFK